MDKVIVGSLVAWYAHQPVNRLVRKKVPDCAELFFGPSIMWYHFDYFRAQGMLMKDKPLAQERPLMRARRGDDGLGANTDIGSKLRALYGAVQEEPIPDRILDLLEKLDEAEQRSGDAGRS